MVLSYSQAHVWGSDEGEHEGADLAHRSSSHSIIVINEEAPLPVTILSSSVLLDSFDEVKSQILSSEGLIFLFTGVGCGLFVGSVPSEFWNDKTIALFLLIVPIGYTFIRVVTLARSLYKLDALNRTAAHFLQGCSNESNFSPLTSH